MQEGWKNLSLKMTESTIFSLVLLFIVIGLAATAAGAALSADQWREYLHLWEESRLVNVSTLDFGLLTAFAPFWIQNDAQRRKWADGERLVPILSVIPLLGPGDARAGVLVLQWMGTQRAESAYFLCSNLPCLATQGQMRSAGSPTRFSDFVRKEI